MVDKSLVSRQEAKIRELETRLEFEKTQVKRLEVGSAWRASLQAEPSCPSGCSHACSEGLCKPGTPQSPPSAKLPGQLTGRGAPLPPAGPALWAPQSLPILHSLSVPAFRQGTRAAWLSVFIFSSATSSPSRPPHSLSGRVINMQRMLPLL